MAEDQLPGLLRMNHTILGLTHKLVRPEMSQLEKEECQRRLQAMECHGAVFVEPTPNFDLQRSMNWDIIADVILKAAERE